MAEAPLPPQRIIYRRYAVGKILSERTRIFNIVESEFIWPAQVEVEIIGSEFDRLVNLFWKLLPAGIEEHVIRRSIQHLAGHLLDRATLRDVCWRLVGNLPRLRRQQPAPPWTAAHQPEWMPMIVLSCKRALSPRQKPGVLLGCQIAAGAACTRMAYKWLSLPICRMLGYECGMRSRHRDKIKRPYAAPEQLVLMRWYGLVTPELCAQSTIGFELPLVTDPQTGMAAFHKRVFSASIREWNFHQTKRRLRVDPDYTCPKDYPTNFLCHFCPVGYKTCPAATHVQAWISGSCDTCDDPDAWMDPELSLTTCVDCAHKLAYRKESS